MNSDIFYLYRKLTRYAGMRKGEIHDLVQHAADTIRALAERNDELHGQIHWITDRDPTSAECRYAGDSGFILCVSGKEGKQTYDHAIMMEECYFEEGVWYICGVKWESAVVHGWMLPPSWEEMNE